jgi:hypothetical protein
MPRSGPLVSAAGARALAVRETRTPAHVRQLFRGRDRDQDRRRHGHGGHLGLTGRLLGELPGILNGEIAGWRRLTERGYFGQPRSALDAQQLEELGSPINAFLRERCETGSSYRGDVDDLYNAYRD